MKRFLNAQFLFPAVILTAFVLVLSYASFFHFQPVRIWEETPEDREQMNMIQMMWINLDCQSEEEYFQGTTTLVRAELVSYEGLFCFDPPTEEDMLFSRSVFTFCVKEVLYDNAPVNPIQVGDTYRAFKDQYAVGNPYESTYTQFRGFIGEEVLLLLDGDPYTGMYNGGEIRNAKAYQQDYVNRMGYRIVDSKWGVIPITREPFLDSFLPPCLHRSEQWKHEDLIEYILTQVEKANSKQ